MRIATLGCNLLFLVSISVNAQAISEYDVMYNKCVDETGPINNSVIAVCSDVASEKAKSEITKRYRSIYDRLLTLNPEDAKKFEASQKAWLQYRNAYCGLTGSYIGPPMYGICPMRLNSLRALELRELDGV